MRSASSCAIASPRPEPADLVAGVEALEDPLARAGVDARAVVGDDQAHVSRLGPCVCGCQGPYLDRRSLRRVSERVVDEDTHDLRDPVRVGDRRRRRRRRRSRSSVPWRSAAGPNSAATRRATSASRTGSRRISIASASSLERSRRSTVSFVSRSTCSRIVLTNSARASGSGRRPRAARRSRTSEKIGVRSSCEALAMNSLRALSSTRETLLHLVERDRELADLVGGVDRDRGREVAVGDLLGRRLEPAQAARVRAGDEPARRRAPASSAIPPAIRIWRRIRATLSSTSARSVAKTAIQRGVSPSRERRRRSPRARTPPTPLDGACDRPRGGRRGGGRIGRRHGRCARARSRRSRTTGSGPPAPSRTPSTVTRAPVRWSMPRTIQPRRASERARAASRPRAGRSGPPRPARAAAASRPSGSSAAAGRRRGR